MNARLIAFPFVLAATAALCAAACTASVSTDPFGAGSVAVGGACFDDRDCLAGDYCDPATQLCVTPSDSPGTVLLGAACTYDAECVAGDVCDSTGVCVADPYATGSESTGQPCDWDADCVDSFCDLDTHTCV
jgi:hypothetical protein